jgi:pSer/pThr/pTyr-binding forkhead associated (FHA) protein
LPEQYAADGEATMLDTRGGAAGFRSAGTGGHPDAIEISIMEGGVFTVGRFDASVGMRQSSFEFDKKTKAVSRRHAAVTRNADGYYLTDLGSSAGTFLDGRKLAPNAPAKMTRGARVSFGVAGAEYVWEE